MNPIEVSWNLLKLSAEDLEIASRTGGVPHIPSTMGGLVGGRDMPLTQGMAQQLDMAQRGEIGPLRAGWNRGTSTLLSPSGKSTPWRTGIGRKFAEMQSDDPTRESEMRELEMEDPSMREGPVPQLEGRDTSEPPNPFRMVPPLPSTSAAAASAASPMRTPTIPAPDVPTSPMGGDPFSKPEQVAWDRMKQRALAQQAKDRQFKESMRRGRRRRF